MKKILLFGLIAMLFASCLTDEQLGYRTVVAPYQLWGKYNWGIEGDKDYLEIGKNGIFMFWQDKKTGEMKQKEIKGKITSIDYDDFIPDISIETGSPYYDMHLFAYDTEEYKKLYITRTEQYGDKKTVRFSIFRF